MMRFQSSVRDAQTSVFHHLLDNPSLKLGIITIQSFELISKKKLQELWHRNVLVQLVVTDHFRWKWIIIYDSCLPVGITGLFCIFEVTVISVNCHLDPISHFGSLTDISKKTVKVISLINISVKINVSYAASLMLYNWPSLYS